MGRSRTPWARAALGAGGLLGASALTGLGVGTLGGLWWVFDLASHFVLYGALGCAVAAALLGLGRCRDWRLGLILAGLVGALLRLGPVLPRQAGDEGEVRIAVFNVLTSNHDHRDAVAWVQGARADVLCAIEVDDRWTDALASTDMVVARSIERRDNFGMALLVDSEVEVRRTRALDFRQIPMIEASLSTGAGPVEVLVVHTLPPITGDAAALRDAHVGEVAAWLEAREGPAFVCGDLNITRWSSAMAPLLAAGRDAREGFGHLGTWTLHGLVPLGIPIDHVITRSLRTTRASVGPHLGSDHLPLVVELTRD